MLVDLRVYRAWVEWRMFTCMQTIDISPSETTLWTVDPMHTCVGFSVRHLMITNVRGEFRQVRGTAVFDRARPEATRIEVDILAASIDTREELRDKHLRSADFFDVENHPRVTFRSTAIRARSGAIGEIDGDLTIRGICRNVTLVVTETSSEHKDHNGVPRIGASATTVIKRSDFGMTYNRVLEAGHLAVGDAVTLTLDVSLMKGAPR